MVESIWTIKNVLISVVDFTRMDQIMKQIMVESIVLIKNIIISVVDFTRMDIIARRIKDTIGGRLMVIAAFLKEKYGIGTRRRDRKHEQPKDEIINHNQDLAPQIMTTPPARPTEPLDPVPVELDNSHE